MSFAEIDRIAACRTNGTLALKRAVPGLRYTTDVPLCGTPSYNHRNRRKIQKRQNATAEGAEKTEDAEDFSKAFRVFASRSLTPPADRLTFNL
ncbi:MAG: hypothetical protein M5R41_12100 [Bacteroidia bacterium]|nr:hypothetical protein [Bacteroidia bacterium]